MPESTKKLEYSEIIYDPIITSVSCEYGTLRELKHLIAAYFYNYAFESFPKPVIIWTILYHMSSVTYSPDEFINLTTISMYHIKFSAYLSANMAIFKTNSSLIYKSAYSINLKSIYLPSA